MKTDLQASFESELRKIAVQLYDQKKKRPTPAGAIALGGVGAGLLGLGALALRKGKGAPLPTAEVVWSKTLTPAAEVIHDPTGAVRRVGDTLVPGGPNTATALATEFLLPWQEKAPDYFTLGGEIWASMRKGLFGQVDVPSSGPKFDRRFTVALNRVVKRYGGAPGDLTEEQLDRLRLVASEMAKQSEA